MNGSERDTVFQRMDRRKFMQTTLAMGVAAGAAPASAEDFTGRQNISLNGMWRIYYDREGRWQKPDWIHDFLSVHPSQVSIPWDEMRSAMESGAEEIKVPATWEEYHPGTVGEAWYWREFLAPESASPGALRLVFNAVRYGAEVFLDGRRVAIHLGGFTPFLADVSDLVKPGGRHQLAVHVVNPGGGEAGNWERLFFENVQIPQSHSFGGIWQDVELLRTSPVFVEDVFVEPHLAEKVALARVSVHNASSGAQRVRIEAQALLPGHVAGVADQVAEVPPQQSLVLELRLRLDPLRLWEPASPTQYRLQVNLRGSSPEIRDAHSVRFGMREFTVRGRFFYLNGRKFMVKSTINHQYYPVTVGYPPTPEFARKEIEVAQKCGLNMMHIHRHVAHPELLDYADELGLLIYEEPGGVIFDESHHLDYPGFHLLLRQLGDMTVRDRNHPALVAWGMANENVLNPEVISHMMQMTRRLDPTRVVCDTSGYGLRMLFPYEKAEKPWRDLHYYPPSPIDNPTYQSMAHFGQPPGYDFHVPDGPSTVPPMAQDGPQIIGEFGYGGLPDIPATLQKFAATGKSSVEEENWKHSFQNLKDGFENLALAGTFGTISEFCHQSQQIHAEAQAEMLQALRTNPMNSGYAVSCFHDLAIWYCGITDVFRDPKLLGARLAQMNVPLFLALYADPDPASTSRDTRVQCTVINENVVRGPAKLTLRITAPGGDTVFTESCGISFDPDQTFVFPGYDKVARLTGPSGHYTLKAELEVNGVVRSANQRSLFAIDPADIRWPREPVLLYDPNKRLLPFFARQNIPHQIWHAGIEARGRNILVGEIDRWFYYEHREAIQKDLVAILEQCRAGSVAGFFIASTEGGLLSLVNESSLHNGPLWAVNSGGSFQGCFHYVKAHGLFEGLPTNALMNREYRQVVPRISLGGFGGETAAGCNQNAFLWGTDVGVIPEGAGAVVLSTLRLADNLGTDPVAERLAANLANWKS